MTRSPRRGFSLVETVIAALILSAGVVTICSISTKSFRMVKVNREKEFAWDLLDRQMTLIDFMGIEEFLEIGETSGTFDDAGPEAADYYWQVEIEPIEIDYLYRISILVGWAQGPGQQYVSLATMINGKGVQEETETPADTQQAPTQTQGQS